ncbi:hypothetical protein TTHERM_000160559 (macronuclear) [Tetrahymena thermophila SB210]|uniref:ERCC4 domain-containing protein n=1 Tax=Tetrahymena thermophila (strain SB210) TaxID=312017 RepID=W7XE74_TETTS|nr:hypothetical protein TTHERM_000160559 [Tetrahymena thermophila SB210]EWS75967.1 hypothetical protein TTHERM_000160559 [Tetrahymena thermophila SB210]|eukprot:XP_012651485.1 hypothetical protein TTHERM_000160559 [Tetrahymena thermophila SB210]
MSESINQDNIQNNNQIIKNEVDDEDLMQQNILNQPEESKLDYFDLIQKDLIYSPTGGLLIMSQGTGVYKVIGEYLDTFQQGPQTVFFLLNFDERDSLKSEINEIQYYCKQHKIVDVTNMISSKRSEIYSKGGIFSISEIVLLFDLLSGSIIHSERITGFIINKIQSVRNHQENLVWLCTLLKTNNPSSIILGISECEQTLASRGLENIMRWFYLPRCFVWNMIRAEVQSDILKQPNQCEHLDTFVDMNKRMRNIDNCIKVIIILILKELKSKRNASDTTELPIFNQEEFLNSHQYILEDKIKSNKFYLKAFMNNTQYFKDAFEFKQLQKDLFQLNCVSFYKKLLYIDQNSNEDSFINRTATDKSTQKVIKELFENAQKRVYEIQKSDETLELPLLESQLNNSDRDSFQFRQKFNLNGYFDASLLQNTGKNVEQLQNDADKDLAEQNDLKRASLNSIEMADENLKGKTSSQENSQNGLNSQGFLDRSADQINLTQSIQMTSIKENIKEDETFEESKNENQLLKQDMLDVEDKHLNENSQDKFMQQMEFMRNIINQDSISLAQDMPKVGLKQNIFEDFDTDNKDAIKFELNQKVKLNLDIDPKFRCLNVILNEINEKYQNAMPINGDKFLIWIHTNDKQRVSSIQEYIQNTFLKNDPSNKLSLMKKFRQFLEEQTHRRHSYLKELIKRKKNQILEEKKECENVLLEQLFKELEYFQQIIEFEQLELNKNQNNQLNPDDNILFGSQRQLNQENKQKLDEMEKEEQKKIKENSQEDSKKQSQNDQNLEIASDEEKNNIKKIRKSDRMLADNEKELLEVKKRKLQIDEKLQKRFKMIDVNSMNVNIIDEIDQTGFVQFLSKQIMKNFEFIVNSTNKSVIRQHFLRTYRPNFVILFEPNLSIIREISVGQHLIQLNGVNPIYEIRTIMFNKSAESEKILYNSLQENQATERIVKEKNEMLSSIDEPVLRVKNITKKANTRIGGSMLQVQPAVIIDKREFRSDLPSILFHEGFKVIPIQLTTGDYILSKDIAVERKSVETPDLVNSLRNGRLYQQLLAMSKNYKKCYLLIEFSEQMPFSLESINYNNENQLSYQEQQNFNNKQPKTNTITFYLPLLVSQFDNVKIIWSKGPIYTSKIFQMLKQNQLEPNPSELLKEQEKKEKKESTIDQYIQANQDDDKYIPTQKRLFEQIKNSNEEEN